MMMIFSKIPAQDTSTESRKSALTPLSESNYRTDEYLKSKVAIIFSKDCEKKSTKHYESPAVFTNNYGEVHATVITSGNNMRLFPGSVESKGEKTGRNYS